MVTPGLALPPPALAPAAERLRLTFKFLLFAWEDEDKLSRAPSLGRGLVYDSRDKMLVVGWRTLELELE